MFPRDFFAADFFAPDYYAIGGAAAPPPSATPQPQRISVRITLAIS